MEAQIESANPVDCLPNAFGPVIPWNGGACPVHPRQIVRLHFRGRGPYTGYALSDDVPAKYHGSIWQHAPCAGRFDPAMDVIAYQVFNG